jgi:hypothetical protein
MALKRKINKFTIIALTSSETYICKTFKIILNYLEIIFDHLLTKKIINNFTILALAKIIN